MDAQISFGSFLGRADWKFPTQSCKKKSKLWADSNLASLHWAEKLNLMNPMNHEEALSQDGLLVFDRRGTDANSSAWKWVLVSIILQEKFGDEPEGKEAGWVHRVSLFHQSTATWYRWVKLCFKDVRSSFRLKWDCGSDWFGGMKNLRCKAKWEKALTTLAPEGWER